MMSDRLRHFLATLSVFLVAIGLMGATPKKSEAAPSLQLALLVVA